MTPQCQLDGRGTKCSTLQEGALLGLSTSCSANLGFFGNFQLVEQLSVHRATSKFMSLFNHIYALAASEAIKNVQNIRI